MKQNERQTPLVVQKVIVSDGAAMPHGDEKLEEGRKQRRTVAVLG